MMTRKNYECAAAQVRVLFAAANMHRSMCEHKLCVANRADSDDEREADGCRVQVELDIVARNAIAIFTAFFEGDNARFDGLRFAKACRDMNGKQPRFYDPKRWSSGYDPSAAAMTSNDDDKETV